MKKNLAIIVLISFVIVYASTTNSNATYLDDKTVLLSITTGDFHSSISYEGAKKYPVYSFDRANNTIFEENDRYGVFQYPLAIGDKLPTVNVKVLEEKDFRHNVTDNTLFKISEVHQYRDQRFVYLIINPFLKNGKVATAFEVNIDLKQSPGKKIKNHNNFVFLNKDYADGLNESLSKKTKVFHKTQTFFGEWLGLKVDEEGIYSISRRDLINAGVTQTIDDHEVYLYAGPGFGLPLRDQFPDSSDFHLKQIPLLFIEGASDDEDKWIFYATPSSYWERQTEKRNIDEVSFIRNSYETTQNFRLFIGSSNILPLRMEQEAQIFTGSEEEQFYYYQRIHHEKELINPAKGGELWFGERLSANNDFPFNLKNLYHHENISGVIRLGIGMVTKGNHYYTLLVSDSTISSFSDYSGDNSEDSRETGDITVRKKLYLSNKLFEDNFNIRVNYVGDFPTAESFLDYIDILYPAEPVAADSQLNLWFLKNDQDRKIQVRGLNAAVSYIFSIEDPFQVKYFPVSGTTADILIKSSNTTSSFLVANESHFKSPLELSLLPNYNPLVSSDHENQVDLIIITPDIFLSEANRLASFKEARALKPLTTYVKTYREILDQYNAGNNDPYAIWHFLIDMYRQTPSPKPRYVLLLGDGHFDYQNRTFTNQNFIPYVYVKDILWPSDDIFVMINSPEDVSNDMAIGRIPANSYDEVKAVVDKIIEYDNRENSGEWQLNAMLVADDPTDLAQDRKGQIEFIRDSEALHKDYIPKVMQVNKIYLTEYPERYITELQTMGRDGAREDIMEAFLNGVSFVNYFGHGDPSVWAQEKVFISNDLVRLDVSRHYPFIVAATCSWGRSDNPTYQSMAEDIVTMESNGAIACLATVRGVTQPPNNNFVRKFAQALFETNSEYAYTPLMGDAVLYSKIATINNKKHNNMKFMYFGDPTIIPAFPQNAGLIDSLSLDSLRALDRVRISGHALSREGNNPELNDLEGKITIYDNDYKVTREYTNPSLGISTISYYLEGNRLFNGDISFEGNSFCTEALIPKDIQYYGRSGKVRMMYWSGDGLFDGAAAIDDIHVGGINPNAISDTQGPVISFMQGNSELLNGAVVYDTSLFKIIFDDQSGVNITGSIGHVLEMSIDNGQQCIDMGELFSYDQNDFTRGGIDIPVSNYFDEGEHLIEISVFDNYNNYSEAELTINVIRQGDDLVRNMVNFPNPFKGRTDITFSTACCGMADIRIYTLSGKPIATVNNIDVSSGFNAITIFAEDDYGHPLAAGVYFYVLELNTGTELIKKHNKMLILP